jgi:prolyl-tRNA editing enzyme YbaK/EbsC (Cys-tRNA(Pro) deacylase)
MGNTPHCLAAKPRWAAPAAWQTGHVVQPQASTEGLHPTARRVQEALASLGSSTKVVEVPTSARTAAEAASSLGTDVGQIVKSLVFVADGRPVLLLVAGDRHVDLAKTAAALGAGKVERAPAALVREATGFAIGGVPPVALSGPLTTLVDRSLTRFAEIWAAAGTPNAVFPTTPEELVRLSCGALADISAG